MFYKNSLTYVNPKCTVAVTSKNGFSFWFLYTEGSKMIKSKRDLIMVWGVRGKKV